MKDDIQCTNISNSTNYISFLELQEFLSFWIIISL